MHAFLAGLGRVSVMQRCSKVAFATRRQAFKTRGDHRKPLGLIAAGSSGALKVYKCQICMAWHVGHR